MSNHEFVAPTPEVQYLPTLFRRIQKGDIRIPAFQRKYVWSSKQSLELLESIYKGYPIGSLLFWRVEENVFKVERDDLYPFPEVEERYPMSFVLDGMQRLATLYGVFHFEDKFRENVFNVVFDLNEEKFIHYDHGDLPQVYLHLSSIFSPKQLLEVQKDLASLESGDVYLDRTVKLQSIFQEYLIPTVTISGRDTSQVVEIFERVNNTGTRFGTVDFMRALTWSEGFDLNDRVEHLQKELEELDFYFEPETLIKGIAVILGKAPIPDQMLTLRSLNSSELNEAVDIAFEVIVRVTEFLKKEFFILSSDFLPYEGQLLVLMKLFHLLKDMNEEVLKVVKKWFWSISFNEGLRGKPDNYVAKFINETEKLVNGSSSNLSYRSTVNADLFKERRFIKGKALSSAIATIFAMNKARSLSTGEIIDPNYFMVEFSGENFQPFYDLGIVQDATGLSQVSAKSFANIIVVTEAEKRFIREHSPKTILHTMYERFGEDETLEILASQFIDRLCVNSIENDIPYEFLSYRAILLNHVAYKTIDG